MDSRSRGAFPLRGGYAFRSEIGYEQGQEYVEKI